MTDEATGKVVGAAPAEAALPKKGKRSGRRLARGKDGLFDVLGAALLARALEGEPGVRRPRRVTWLAKQLGLHYRKGVTRWRQRKARPELPQALALQALFPWIPVASWLTADERLVVQAALALGQALAAEPPPNPKTGRKKNKPDPRQVTLEEMIAMKTPPKKPAASVPVILDEPDLGDWDPNFDERAAGAEP